MYGFVLSVTLFCLSLTSSLPVQGESLTRAKSTLRPTVTPLQRTGVTIVFTDDNKHLDVDAYKKLLPADWFTTLPLLARYRIVLTANENVIQYCPYTGQRQVHRVVINLLVQVFDQNNERRLNSHLFYGTSPARCASTERFGQTEYTKYLYGPVPKETEVTKWLIAQMKRWIK